MAALTQGRRTAQSSGDKLVAPVAAAVKLQTGALIAMTAAGTLTPGATALNLKGVGISMDEVDNSGGAAGGKTAEIDRRPAWFDNSGTDPLTLADVKSDCYMVDDHTVAKTNGTNTRSVAGRVLNVDANRGVLVSFI